MRSWHVLFPNKKSLNGSFHNCCKKFEKKHYKCIHNYNDESENDFCLIDKLFAR